MQMRFGCKMLQLHPVLLATPVGKPSKSQSQRGKSIRVSYPSAPMLLLVLLVLNWNISSKMHWWEVNSPAVELSLDPRNEQFDPARGCFPGQPGRSCWVFTLLGLRGACTWYCREGRERGLYRIINRIVSSKKVEVSSWNHAKSYENRTIGAKMC